MLLVWSLSGDFVFPGTEVLDESRPPGISSFLPFSMDLRTQDPLVL